MIASKRKHARPLRIRALMVPFFLLLVLITFLGIIFEYKHVNEWMEHNIFKGAFLHAFWETMGGYVHLPEGEKLTVFMHVPRTSNDAMRTHLYGSPRYQVDGLAVDNSPIWPRFLEKWPKTFLSKELIAKARLPSTKIIKGYFSRRDMIRLNVTNKRTIIFLRHPMERVLSLLNMIRIKQGGKLLSPAEVIELPQRYHDHNKPQTVINRWICSFTHNSMAWQLGDQQHCRWRAQLTDAELLSRAKKTLETADLVGFYATLDQDFWHLWRHFFPTTHSWLTSYVPFAFWIGTRLSIPRLQVLKYTSMTSQEDLSKIRGYNELDFALYEWAIERFRPGLRLYSGYDEWMWDHLFAVLAMAMGCCCGMYSCWGVCCCLFRRRRYLCCCYYLCSQQESPILAQNELETVGLLSKEKV